MQLEEPCIVDKSWMQEDVAVCRHEVESFILLTLGGC
jgi:hypothetical protein